MALAVMEQGFQGRLREDRGLTGSIFVNQSASMHGYFA
jgi:hypothetical protein